MRHRNIGTVFLKEWRDLLRDRRAVISMVVVPTLLMPGLMLIAGMVAYTVNHRARSSPPAVMILGAEDSPAVRTALAGDTRIKVVPATADWRQRISDKAVQAAIEVPAGFDASLAGGTPARVTIFNYDGELRSGVAVSEVRRILTDYRDRVIAGRLATRGLPPTLVRPFDISARNVAAPEKVGGNVIGGIIPYFFLLLSFSGAMYAAIDLTAGEKERGTMETLLCSPVGRTELVLGKFLVVLTASLATVAFSLASTAGTMLVGGLLFAARAGAAVTKGAAAASAPLPTLDPLGMLAVVGMVIPVAVLFAAVQLTIALFARSFKEAQSYLSPLAIVIIVPAVIGMIPGVELDARLALVPVLNVSLVSKELVSGVWHWDLIALIFGSTCVYAAGALALAVRMFRRESVLFRT